MAEAFKFIMLTVLGNSDVSVIYDVSPVLGSLLIIMFLVSIFFIIMRLCSTQKTLGSVRGTVVFLLPKANCVGKMTECGCNDAQFKTRQISGHF